MLVSVAVEDVMSVASWAMRCHGYFVILPSHDPVLLLLW